jgi:hypothetical protein
MNVILASNTSKMKQVTLVSLYGHKPKTLVQLVHGCRQIIQSSPLRRLFRPYHLGQIHGTLIGMEKLIGYSDHFNANRWVATGKKTVMDFNRLLSTLQKHLPVMVRFGGFQPTFNAFASFGRCPYERSFQIQWATRRFTIIGWPHDHGDFLTNRSLDNLRGALGKNCNIQHKYKNDNDLFMVIGEMVAVESFSDLELAQLRAAARAVEIEVRDFLATQSVDVMIDADHLCLAQYEEETLALNSTISYPITKQGIDAGFISDLYQPARPGTNVPERYLGR